MQGFQIEVKVCSFLCGSKTTDKDPVDPDRAYLRWSNDKLDGPATALGANDWYCERAWDRIAHLAENRDREKHKKLMGRDSKAHSQFMTVRVEVIERAKKKATGGGRSQRGVMSAARTQRFTESTLVRPDDQFWPMNRYKAKFGSPDLPRNKSLNHRRAVVDGQTGVVVPGDDGIGPFLLRHSSGVRLEHDENEIIESGDDMAADEKFEDLKAKQQGCYKEVACGALAGILKGFVLDDEERDEEMKRIQVAAKKRKQRKKTDTDAAAQESKRRRGMFALAHSDDESNDDPSFLTPGKKGAVPRKALNKLSLIHI